MCPSMPCHEFKVDKRSWSPVFGKYVHLKEEPVSTCEILPPSPSDLPFKWKNQSLHARYTPPSPSDMGGNYSLSTKNGLTSSRIKGHDMK